MVQNGFILAPGPDINLVLDAAKRGLNAYLRKIRRVSYDATRSGLITALSSGGVQNVALVEPAQDIVCGFYDVSAALNIDVEVTHVDI